MENIKISQIMTIFALILLLISIPLPWIKITFIGEFDVSLSDIYGNTIDYVLNSEPSSPTDDNLEGYEAISEYLPSAFSLLIALILFPVALITGIFSLRDDKLYILSGGSSIFTTILWIFGVQSLKNSIASELSADEIWGSLFSEAFSNMVKVGTGAYIPIFVGLLMILIYYLSKKLSGNISIRFGQNEDLNTETKVDDPFSSTEPI